MSEGSFNVLFVCNENSTRSIVAEAVLRHWGRGRFQAFSAGIRPAGQVDPTAIEQLRASDLPTEGLRSKDLKEFSAPGAPEMDFVISVCDKPAIELRGTLPGNPLLAHWTITDPAAGWDNAAKRGNALRRAFQELENRVRLFVLLRHQRPTQPVPEAHPI